MAKQVVTIVNQANSTVILINGVDPKRYHRNPAEFESYRQPLLNGKKEFEEVTEGNKIHYWVRVPDLIDTTGTKAIKSNVVSAYEKKKKEKYDLIRRKNERMNRYRWCIENDIEITPTTEDINDGLKLQQLQNRKKMTKNKKLIQDTLVTALNPDIFEDDYFPDNLV